MPREFLFLPCLLLFLFCSSMAYCQLADSTVIRRTLDYAADTIAEDNLLETRFRNKKEVYSLQITYRGRHWFDSSITKTDYSPDGKPLQRTKYEVTYNECIPKPPAINYPSFYQNLWQVDTPPAPVITSCNARYTAQTVFTDTTEITHSMYADERDTIEYDDTVYYNAYHLPVRDVHTQSGQKQITKQYTYEYNAEGKASAIRIVTNDRGSITCQYTRKMYDGDREYETQYRSYKDYDSLHFDGIDRTYDEHFNQIRYKQYKNGQFSGFGYSPYSEISQMSENITYGHDSAEIDHHTYRWVNSKHRKELWSNQHYKNFTEYNGVGYGRYDTLFKKNTVVITSCGANHNKRVNQYKRPRCIDCHKYQYVVTDLQGRLLSVTNYDYDTRKKSSVTTFTYSR